jgi:hypothetical protein
LLTRPTRSTPTNAQFDSFYVIEAELWQAAEQQLTLHLIEEESQRLVHEKERRLESRKREEATAAEQKKILELLRTPT